MPFSKALNRSKARGLHAECPKTFLLQPAAEASFEGPSLLDELVQQQEANRRRVVRPLHHAIKAAKHLKRVFLLPQGKRAQPEAQLEGLSLDNIEEPCKAVGLKGFDSTCTLTTAASDDASECSLSSSSGGALGFVDPEEAALEELAVAMAHRSLNEVLHPSHPSHHARHHHHQGKHKKAAAHLRRLHSHADLDLHAPIRFLI